MNSLLLDAVQAKSLLVQHRMLLLSINPDLKSDFGHYLNYEKRINEDCKKVGIFHHCLSHIEFTEKYPFISGVFENDSGHYCLHRQSAAGRELEITKEFQLAILDWISLSVNLEYFDEIRLFIYMSSAKSASILSCLKWPKKISLICNSFWDFLSPASGENVGYLARFSFQSKVSLLALSSTYRKIVSREFGFNFDFIPNPPPLTTDEQFYSLVRESFTQKMIIDKNRRQILMPGLMSMGKGREFSSQFLLKADTLFPNCNFLVRDRKDELKQEIGGQISPRVKLAPGDYSDNEIITFYQNSDIAILPYSSEVFHFRTSGALVDCLMSATIPVVLPNTWLSDMCIKYDFGVVANSESIEDVISSVQYVIDDFKNQLNRMLPASLKYMRENSWMSFIAKISNRSLDQTSQAPIADISNSNTNKHNRNYPQIKPKSYLTQETSRNNVSSNVGIIDSPKSVALEKLITAKDLSSMNLLITTVGSRWLLNKDHVASDLRNHDQLEVALKRALDSLPNNDHKKMFLRICKRAGCIDLMT